MSTVTSPRLAVSIATVAFLLVACADDASAPPASGTGTLTNDSGIDFTTGAVMKPGNYANSDIFATVNGDAGLKLSTGGDNPTQSRSITWHRNAGMIPRTFNSLAEVPTDLPSGFDPIPNAKTRYGFVLETHDGDHIRGWIENASATSVTIQWDRVP